MPNARFALATLLVLATAAESGMSYISLEPEQPGPYAPNQELWVDVLFHNAEGQGIIMRHMTLDFSSTDPAIELPWTFHFCYWCNPKWGPDVWWMFDDMPKVDMVYLYPEPGPWDLVVGDGDAQYVGELEITLPDEPGTYTLDAINAASPDFNNGAFFSYGFDPRVNLHYTLGNLTGGTVDLVVVPEPATVALLGVGGLALVIRRRRRDA